MVEWTIITMRTQEAAALLNRFSPAHASIHGRQYASRIDALMPKLTDFFKANKELVPSEYHRELDALTAQDIENWQRVAMLRASGRNTATGFVDKGSGFGYKEGGKANCKAYLEQMAVSSPASAERLANAIVEADSGKPKSLLGWVLQHATTPETMRDQKNKDVNIGDLPAWKQAKSSPVAGWEIRGLAAPDGRYAIGGGKSVGWRDPKNAQIIRMPDSTYVQQVEQHLQRGEVPLASEQSTMLDIYLRSADEIQKNHVADLVSIYAVKQVMQNLAVPVEIQMVDNNRADTLGHDRHAMRVQFASQKEAEAFAKKLFEEHGIHSHTFGPGVMKTPQNGCIFLTKDDLEKITQASKISYQPGSGALAYMAKAEGFERGKRVDRDMDRRDKDDEASSLIVR